jgi:hypothetical protein
VSRSFEFIEFYQVLRTFNNHADCMENEPISLKFGSIRINGGTYLIPSPMNDRSIVYSLTTMEGYSLMMVKSCLDKWWRYFKVKGHAYNHPTP